MLFIDPSGKTSYVAPMKNRLIVAFTLLFTSLGCGGLASLGGGGLDSPECQEYFKVVKECSKKAEKSGSPAGKAKADAWRKSAKIARESFEKNPSAPAIAQSCEAMIAPIKNDADCK